MRDIAVVDGLPAADGVVVSLVQAQVLFASGALYHRLFDRGPQQLEVVDVRPGAYCAQRAAVAFNQDASLRPGLAPVRRVRADEAPPILALPIAPSAACHF